MISDNKWKLSGHIVTISEVERGFWISVKGTLQRTGLYKSDECEINCFVNKSILSNSYKRFIPYTHVKVIGKLIYLRDNSCYLIAEHLST